MLFMRCGLQILCGRTVNQMQEACKANLSADRISQDDQIAFVKAVLKQTLPRLIRFHQDRNSQHSRTHFSPLLVSEHDNLHTLAEVISCVNNLYVNVHCAIRHFATNQSKLHFTARRYV